jgi:enoyl-CoA hydratase
MAPLLVQIERRDDDVAVLRLDNPKVNALSMELLRQLETAAATLTDDPPGAVVVTGGDRLFAAGADIAEFGGPDEAERIGDLFLRALGAVADIPRATIAAVSGVALGGGCELALACDFRIASTRARFAQPEILLGIIPGGGGTQRLPRLIGPSRAKDMIFSGRQVGAEEALRIGLVNRVATPGRLDAATAGLIDELMANGDSAVGLAKRILDAAAKPALAVTLEMEVTAQDTLVRTQDFAQRLHEYGAGRRPS